MPLAGLASLASEMGYGCVSLALDRRFDAVIDAVIAADREKLAHLSDYS